MFAELNQACEPGFRRFRRRGGQRKEKTQEQTKMGELGFHRAHYPDFRREAQIQLILVMYRHARLTRYLVNIRCGEEVYLAKMGKQHKRTPA